jgi:hypothetical protein
VAQEAKTINTLPSAVVKSEQVITRIQQEYEKDRHCFISLEHHFVKEIIQ